ncbi:hypothetical protein TRVA0_074S00144 [Trichomonascus vanleenenianus]|uniref:uncharacterized protein n=1 Tax=Trichomonascus vanleenenianus TaxID=2268995 RepID=UPI003EC96BA0
MWRKGVKPLGRRLLNTNAHLKTVINPTDSIKNYLDVGKNCAFTPASMIIAGTPQYAEDIYSIVNKSPIQTVGFAVDSIPFGAQRDGLSIMYLKGPLSLKDIKPMSSDEPTSRSVNARGLVNARENWALPESYVSIGADKHTQVIVPGANTLFTLGTEAMISTNMVSSENNLLSSLHVELPEIQLEETQAHAAPLVPVHPLGLEITSFKDNMIKTIEDRPAASFLENSSDLMEVETESQLKRKVYAVIESPGKPMRRFEVLSGGGGSWSPRASMLVLENGAEFLPGDKISFFYTEPGKKELELSLLTSIGQFEKMGRKRLAFEAAPMLEVVDEASMNPYPKNHVIHDLFGVGSEKGFLLNDSKHSVAGEISILTGR